MFFTKITGAVAGITFGLGLAVTVFAVYSFFGNTKSMGAVSLSFGLTCIVTGCLIGVLVEISNSLNEIKKVGRVE